MSDDWISLEQEVRDRITEARDVARTYALARQARARRPEAHAMGKIGGVSGTLARAITRAFNRLRGLGSPRTPAAKRM